MLAMPPTPDAAPAKPPHETSVLETLRSLIVAFVLAMAFRGFVLEGFVIPTGSMAPTLMGQHTRWHSTMTGYEFPVDAGPHIFANLPRTIEDAQRERTLPIYEPMLDETLTVTNRLELYRKHRMGDRILIIKGLYPFNRPHRFDVVVFKNPTDPFGPSQNYIKRLIGLPDEKIWLADGDVFAGPRDPGKVRDQSTEGFSIQRKPEHVQRAVWQLIYDSDYVALHPTTRRGPPWQGGPHWRTQRDLPDGSIGGLREYRCDTAEPAALEWDEHVLRLSDRTTYDMLPIPQRVEEFPVSDLRVSAGVMADQPGLAMTLEIEARGHVFQFALAGGEAKVRMRPVEQPDGWLPNAASGPAPLPAPGRV
ncbi:MAG: S26 family signal peptidase, partial [Gemmatimonadetes bacterium]|nr:S26 family signal peptidase [Gemmatimonadota bacterium]